ncbi:MAG: glycosyltransferase [Candidatus Helarchaeota archaeon]|nr:glycosyltransferase [Candidatus Helarchaeota archaeon]
MLSVLIPVRNEAQNITPLVLQLREILENRAHLDYEVIFIDDYSSDNTVDLLNTISQKNPSIKVIQKHFEKRGVGISYKIGLSHSKGEYFLTMDADFSHRPPDILKLLKALSEGTDLVIGSRYIKRSQYYMQSPRKVFSRLFNSFLRHLFQVSISDITSGFRIVKTKRLLELQLTGEKFEIHPEINLKAAFSHFKIKEVPITFIQRRRGKSKLNYLQMLSRYVRLIINLFIEKVTA